MDEEVLVKCQTDIAQLQSSFNTIKWFIGLVVAVGCVILTLTSGALWRGVDVSNTLRNDLRLDEQAIVVNTSKIAVLDSRLSAVEAHGSVQTQLLQSQVTILIERFNKLDERVNLNANLDQARHDESIKMIGEVLRKVDSFETELSRLDYSFRQERQDRQEKDKSNGNPNHLQQ